MVGVELLMVKAALQINSKKLKWKSSARRRVKNGLIQTTEEKPFTRMLFSVLDFLKEEEIRAKVTLEGLWS